MNRYKSSFLWFICLVSAMGGLLFGYDWVVIGGAKIFYEQYFGIVFKPVLQGLAMSVALAGCMIGALTAGTLADRIGRRSLLGFAACLSIVTASGTGAFNQFGPFLAARFFGGIAIGIASGLSPMYIAEVAPTEIRGRLVSLNQLTIVIGILSAQIVNWRLVSPDMAWNVSMAWRWMFWAAAFPATAFLLMVFFIPESPRWLALNGHLDKARDVLSRIGGEEYALRESASIIATMSEDKGSEEGLKVLFSRPFRAILVLGVIVAVFQQWCGTNVIFNYAQEIFQ
ncbi:MAG: MFS transporter, partial [Bacteroidales bacterium]|nr:MFS transporter [Bacteroidales bacterium]